MNTNRSAHERDLFSSAVRQERSKEHTLQGCDGASRIYLAPEHRIAEGVQMVRGCTGVLKQDCSQNQYTVEVAIQCGYMQRQYSRDGHPCALRPERRCLASRGYIDTERIEIEDSSAICRQSCSDQYKPLLRHGRFTPARGLAAHGICAQRHSS